MRLRILSIVICALLMVVSDDVRAGKVVGEFKGSGNQRTAEFEVQGPWILDWRVSSGITDRIGFELHLVNAATGFAHSRIMARKTTGVGIKLFNERGKYRFRISSSYADWFLRVTELSDAEAEQYKPVPDRRPKINDLN